MEQQTYKRNTAYKMRISDILAGKPIMENDRLKFLESENKQVVRINVIANVIDKYAQEGEKKFASITLDDGSGQLKVKTFGEETEKFSALNQGDTLLVIGLLRSWNSELYITPEIIKKKEPLYLLVRKLEDDAQKPKRQDKEQLLALKEKIINMVREAEKDQGIEIEKLILELHESPDTINAEIKKLLEDGVAFEPRPGKLRWLG